MSDLSQAPAPPTVPASPPAAAASVAALPPPVLMFSRKKREGWGMYLLGLVGALGLHYGTAIGGQSMPVEKIARRIEMATVKKNKPAPPPPPPVEPPKPKPEPPKPKQLAKAPVKYEMPKEPPAPPPPNQTPPKDPPKKPVPILSGVTLESTVAGDSGFQVAVGNTLYDDPNKNKSKPGDVKPYSAPVYREAPAPAKTGGTGVERGPFKPVPKYSVSTEPEVSKEVKATYPLEARQAGIEGVVELRVEIWEDGTVRTAKVVRGLGYGLDEAALDAIKRFLFKPATMDGKAVQYTIPRYSFRFELEG